jgi:hypothetical protein
MWKYLGYFCLLIGFTDLLFSMNESHRAWRYSDQHKLIKGQKGIIMDYSYDHSTSRWILNSECWADVVNNYFTRQYEKREFDVLVCIFYQNPLGSPILLSERSITIEEYAALDFKPGIH